MDTFKAGIALAPDQLARIKGGHDEEEQHRAALHRLQHEIGHRPDVDAFNTAGKMAIVERYAGHQDGKDPERNITNDIADPQPSEAEVLRKGRAEAEQLMHHWNPGNGAAARRLNRLFFQAGLPGFSPAGPCGK